VSTPQSVDALPARAGQRSPARLDGAVLLLRLKDSGRLALWDVASQTSRPLPGGIAQLADGAEVVPLSRGGLLVSASGVAYAVTGDGGVTELGPAGAAVPAGFDSAWLLGGAEGERTARLVGLDGVNRSEPTAVPQGGVLVGATPTRLLFGQPYPGQVGPLLVVQPESAPQRVLSAAVIHDADWRGVVWTDCLPCPPRYSQLGGGFADAAAPLTHPPPEWSLVGPVQLSPDGRHWAALGATGYAQTTRALIVGHVPWTPRADVVSVHETALSTANEEPVLQYAKSGWVFASDGQQIVAVSPGPHSVYQLSGLPPHDLLAVR
jgi:hypothetical protein